MKYRAFSILGAVVCSVSAAAAADRPRTYEQINANVTPANIKFFEDYLSQCPAHEIRCVWFLRDHIKVGMVMTIDMKMSSVETVREVYDLAHQTQETRKLSGVQVASLRQIAPALPPTVKDVLFGKGVHVACWKDGKAQTATYHRMAAPLILQRLYDIGGGYLDCKYAK